MADPRLLAEMVGFLGDSMTGGTDYAAERNGKHKQALAAASNKLPRRVDRDDRLVYEALGFVFGDATDKLFMAVSFPDGWGTKPTDHYRSSRAARRASRDRVRYFAEQRDPGRDPPRVAALRRILCPDRRPMTASKTDTVPGLRVARIWLDLTQEDAARDAGVSARTYKKWDLGLTQNAALGALSEEWGIPIDVLVAEAPAVDYKRLREFVAANGGIARVEAALRFLARLEAAEEPTIKGPRALAEEAG